MNKISESSKKTSANKVYLVEIQDGREAVYCPTIEKIFLTYRRASEWLIEEEYSPCYDYDDDGKIQLCFCWEDDEGCFADVSYANITEMEISE